MIDDDDDDDDDNNNNTNTNTTTNTNNKTDVCHVLCEHLTMSQRAAG